LWFISFLLLRGPPYPRSDRVEFGTAMQSAGMGAYSCNRRHRQNSGTAARAARRMAWMWTAKIEIGRG